MADTGSTLGQVASSVNSSFTDLANLITAGSYAAGIGFSAASILKFKSHNDNPTQIPISTPEALAASSAILTFLPDGKTAAAQAGVTKSGAEAAAEAAGATPARVSAVKSELKA